ncbi:MAG: MerR family transcriptional regulator [Anaerolineaceae bacterium]|nr:MerR family transcriptional regulator [Anaerolineaceae bacterium]
MKIGEVSRKYELSQDTLRFYEREGLIPTVNRNASGIRDYTEADLRWVEFVKCMRSAGLPIEVLSEYVSLVMEGDGTIEERKAILEAQRDLLAERIKEMQRTMLILEYKIRIYDGRILQTEKELAQQDEVV